MATVGFMQPDSAPVDLASGYAELERIDAALAEAERQLDEAHRDGAGRAGPPPDALYREVVRLRQCSRQLLNRLCDLLIAGD